MDALRACRALTACVGGCAWLPLPLDGPAGGLETAEQLDADEVEGEQEQRPSKQARLSEVAAMDVDGGDPEPADAETAAAAEASTPQQTEGGAAPGAAAAASASKVLLVRLVGGQLPLGYSLLPPREPPVADAALRGDGGDGLPGTPSEPAAAGPQFTGPLMFRCECAPASP